MKCRPDGHKAVSKLLVKIQRGKQNMETNVRQLNIWFNLRSWVHRHHRFGSISLGIAILLVSFQNCKMSPTCEAGSGGEGCPASTASSSSANDQSSAGSAAILPGGNGSTNLGGGQGGAGSQGRAPNSAILGGGTNSGVSQSSGGAILGGGSGAGSTGGSQGPILGGGQVGTGDSGSSKVFRFIAQPKSVQVEWNGFFDLEVSLAGGTPPYSFQWYKDDQAVTEGGSNYGLGCSTSYSCRGMMDSYSRDGRYKVVVKDSSRIPQALTSTVATISVADPAGLCAAGSYVMYTGGNSYGSNLVEMFQNVRGTFLISAGNDAISYMTSYPKYYPITIVYDMPAATFQQSVPFPSLCGSQIPNINSASSNPGQASGEYGLYGCGNSNGCGYHREGAVTMECKNARWRFVSNTCRWVRDVPVDGSSTPRPPLNDG
ncbi:MAG: hypothetical protein IPK04_06220 [Bdellovibrionales bacterium]|nr:hypothetical protein [Bdellovibrionales bacterium]